MANSYGRQAAIRPANTSENILLTAGIDTYIGKLNVCNQDTVDHTFSIAIADAAGAAANEDWLYYNFYIAANGAFSDALNIGPGQYLIVQASIADKLSFLFHGLKITP